MLPESSTGQDFMQLFLTGILADLEKNVSHLGAECLFVPQCFWPQTSVVEPNQSDAANLEGQANSLLVFSDAIMLSDDSMWR